MYKNVLSSHQMSKAESLYTPSGFNHCKDCKKLKHCSLIDMGYWRCDECMAEREKRIQQHIRRIRSNPLYREDERTRNGYRAEASVDGQSKIEKETHK